MMATKGMLLKPESGEQAPKSSQRIVYLSVVLFVAGRGEQGAPQKDLSNGEGVKDNMKIATKCRKVDPTQPITHILHYFFAYSSIL
jgi:hypothetical protein